MTRLRAAGRWWVDRRTDYRSRYGYPCRWALWAELWWRVEHWPAWTLVTSRAYRWRKGSERRGHAAGSRAGTC